MTAQLKLWGGEEAPLPPAGRKPQWVTKHFHGTDALTEVRNERGRLTGRTMDGSRVKVTRSVQWNKNGSKHVCNAACMGARGMTCECSCGGRNHGKWNH